ncbi:MAG: hypothetical protein O3C40_16455 [Planctomycetota bacterium]|nr:hypothetical protein [Planctomycetota bacterium]
MPIETTCPGCGRKLQVGEEHAGKQARCPLCNEIYSVPLSVADGAATTAEQAVQNQWRMRTPEGQTYGPVSNGDLDAWVREGRVSADCWLASDTNTDWVHADAVYPALTEPKKKSPVAAPRPVERYVAGHRGGLILALGIISWTVFCPIFGICAWVMGSADLREMRAGRLDASGTGLTQAGQIIGMLHALLTIIVIVVFVFVLLLGVGWR